MKKKSVAGLATGLFMFGVVGISDATIIGGGITEVKNLNDPNNTIPGSFKKYINPIPSGFTVGNDNFNDNNLHAFDENQNIVLGTALNVVLDTTPYVGAVLATGTEVASHYIFFDPLELTNLKGYIEFDSDVLGILVSTASLFESDVLMNTDVTYENPSSRGLEIGNYEYPDWARIDPDDPRKVLVDFWANTPGDCIRVLTDHSPGAEKTPEPATMLLFGTGMAGLAGTRLRRKKK